MVDMDALCIRDDALTPVRATGRRGNGRPHSYGTDRSLG